MAFDFSWRDRLDGEDYILAGDVNSLAAGIEETQTAVTNKVDKVSGKGLSTNDYTTAEKTKLAGIETGANKTTVDSELSDTSENPVQNKIITTQINSMQSVIDNLEQYTMKLLSFNWDGDLPVMYINGTEPAIEVNVNDGYFKLDGEPIKTTGGSNTMLLNFEVNGVESINAGITYITAKLNLKTFHVDVDYSDTYVEPTLNNEESYWKLTILKTYAELNSSHDNIVTNYITDYSKSVWISSLGLPTSATVTGVKGDSESTYRTGDVNLTAENVGALAEDGTAAAATKLETARKIDGMDFDGSADIVHYATCSTAAGTAAKAVTLNGFTITTGASITIKFTYGNTASSPTLSITSDGTTTAKSIVKYGTTASMAYMWQAGEVVEFLYDGTNWVMLKGGLATTTYYGLTKLSSSTSSTSTALAATPSAVKSAYDLANTANTAAATAQSTADSKKRTATLVVGTSTAGYTASDVDYLCDGTADQTEINAAITALPSGGGKIVVLEGEYTITGALTCNKNVIIEGMGNGTIINCTSHAFLNNTSTGYRIELKNIKFNLTGTLAAASPFIKAYGDFGMSGCTVTASATTVTEQWTDYILTYANARITDTTFNITTKSTYSGGACCAIFGFTDGYNNAVSRCDITLTNNTASSYYLNLHVTRGSDTISNCRITLVGAGSGRYAYITDSRTTVTGCYINAKNSYGDVSKADLTSNGGAFTGNTMYYANGGYIQFARVSDNYFNGSGTLYFQTIGAVITGNRFINSAANSISGTSYTIFKNNALKYSCTVTSSTGAIVSDNVVYSSLA